jgi:hypothetical protein
VINSYEIPGQEIIKEFKNPESSVEGMRERIESFLEFAIEKVSSDIKERDKLKSVINLLEIDAKSLGHKLAKACIDSGEYPLTSSYALGQNALIKHSGKFYFGDEEKLDSYDVKLLRAVTNISLLIDERCQADFFKKIHPKAIKGSYF